MDVLYSHNNLSPLGYFTLKSHPGDLQGTDNSVFHVALEVKESVFPFVLKLRSCALREKKSLSEKDECSLTTLREPCSSFYGWAAEFCCLCLLIIRFPEPL